MSKVTSLLAEHNRAGWLVWLTLAGSITFTVLLSIWLGQERSVTPAYCSAVENWFAGEPLYTMQGHGFLYLPQAALVFAPWAILPHSTCEIVWRLSIIAVLAFSVVRLTRLLNGDGRWYGVLSLAAAAMGWGCARNGQSTLLITGLMILAVVDLAESRWWRATILLAIAFAFKPFAIVLILLAAVIYPQMSWRLAIGLFVVAIAPFAMQRPDYVISQYVAFNQSLQITIDVGDSEKWAQVFGMLEVAGLKVPSSARTILRLIAAVATLFLCWKASRNLSPQRSAYYLYSLAACYLMLFNSRTEGNTYAMVGPVYGVLLAEALFQKNRGTVVVWAMSSAIVLSVLNYDLAVLITSRPDAIWISPLVCVGVTGYLVLRLCQDLRRASSARRESLKTGDSLSHPLERAVVLEKVRYPLAPVLRGET